MPMPSLKIEHRQQVVPTGCLAACAQMILTHLGIKTTQTILNDIFELTPAGVPASRLIRLEHYGVDVVFEKGEAEDIRNAIDREVPIIVFVRTAELSYWTLDTQHALVISGYDQETFLLNDPAFPEPKRVPNLEMMLAWDEFDNRYALIRISNA